MSKATNSRKPKHTHPAVAGAIALVMGAGMAFGAVAAANAIHANKAPVVSAPAKTSAPALK
jgi:hypothetical protein